MFKHFFHRQQDQIREKKPTLWFRLSLLLVSDCDVNDAQHAMMGRTWKKTLPNKKSQLAWKKNFRGKKSQLAEMSWGFETKSLIFFSTRKPGIISVILSVWRASLLSAHNIWLRRPLQVSRLSGGKLSFVAKMRREVIDIWLKKGKPDVCVRVRITKPPSANKKKKNFSTSHLFYNTRTHLASTWSYQRQTYLAGIFSISKCFIWAR